MRLIRGHSTCATCLRSLTLVVCLCAVALSATSCGQVRQPGPEHGSVRGVTESIREAKSHQTWLTRQKFCQMPWRGPQEQHATAASLVLEKSMTKSDTTLMARIENFGRSALGYGVAPKVDQLVGSTWHPRQFRREGRAVGFNLSLSELRSRSTSGCLEVPVSDNWSAGLYRVWFELERWGRLEETPAVKAVAYFRVVQDARRS